jgi:hypothetical protein
VIRAHLDAVMALLASLTSAPTNMPVVRQSADALDQAPVLPGTRVTPYVVVRTDSMPMESRAIAQYSGNLHGLIYVTHVGESVKEAQWAQEKTRVLLLDKKPTVTGRSVGRLSLADSSPVQTDRDVQPPLIYVVDVYRLFSA